MLDYILEQTEIYLQNMDKEKRKKIGQFFTSKETAKFMAGILETKKEHLKILDPGAGSGILSATLISKLQNTNVKSIDLTLYENDNNILPLLHKNIEYMTKTSSIIINYSIIEKNYILDNKDDFNSTLLAHKDLCKYDFIICNPPYLKISKDAPEAKAMPLVCYGAPNMYFLFMSMALFELKENSQMVFIIPRSWTSGAYFKKFREYLLLEARIKHIHLFVSRNKVFEKEKVLQETIIVHIVKTKEKLDLIEISSTESNFDFKDINSFMVPYNLAVSEDENKFVYLPINKEEVEILNKINKFKYTLQEIGIRLKTGLTVSFRNRGLLHDKADKENVPLIYSTHFKNGTIEFPIQTDKKQYIDNLKKGLVQKNKDYLFIKRFTSKEEKRRIQPAIYLKNICNKYDYISTDNKINFIDTIDKNEILTKDEIYGLYIVFNSTLYGKYYRILNGSTQVNATEINYMHVPNRKQLKEIGKRIQDINDLSVKTCDEILEELLDGEVRRCKRDIEIIRNAKSSAI